MGRDALTTGENKMDLYTDDELIMYYNVDRATANMIALELESRGYTGYYIKPDGVRGLLDPSTRPTEFVFEK